MISLLKAKPAQSTPVSTKHIKYIEPLWEQIAEGRKTVTAKADYVRAARQTGLALRTVDRTESAAVVDERRLNTAEKTLERIKQVLAAGCEPTTPNDGWYCGALTEPKKVKRQRDMWSDTFKGYPDETWPCYQRRLSSRTPVVAVFEGVMPVTAIEKLAKVKHLFDDLRIYSPNEDDFRTLRNPAQRMDPVLIGRIEFLGEPKFFEIARWDIDKDLQALHSRVSRR